MTARYLIFLFSQKLLQRLTQPIVKKQLSIQNDANFEREWAPFNACAKPFFSLCWKQLPSLFEIDNNPDNRRTVKTKQKNNKITYILYKMFVHSSYLRKMSMQSTHFRIKINFLFKIYSFNYKNSWPRFIFGRWAY